MSELETVDLSSSAEFHGSLSCAILHGHVLDRLPDIEAESVQTIVTSPPYFGLRDYGLEPVIWPPIHYAPMPGMPEISHENDVDWRTCKHEWGAWKESHDVREVPISGKTRTTDRCYGGNASRRFDGNHQKHAHGQFCQRCGAWRGCLGLEPDSSLYVGHLVDVFRGLRRVLRKDGTAWLNLGDSYANGGQADIKQKDLMGIPWRVAFALQADGWWLRSDIVWSKTNGMPESVTDRPTRTHEMLFLLARSQTYFYDHIAVRKPHKAESVARQKRRRSSDHKWRDGPGDQTLANDLTRALHSQGANLRDVWQLSTKPFRGAHFAVMPPDLVEPCILAGTPKAGVCVHCGKPYVRNIRKILSENPDSYNGSSFTRGKTRDARAHMGIPGNGQRTAHVETIGWIPGCDCTNPQARPAVVLDPFGGSGTVGMVARNLGRDWKIIEANPDYAEIAKGRIMSSRTTMQTTLDLEFS